jgi:hypothetical protein
VGALPEIHVDQFDGEAEQGQQQFGPVGVAGEGEAVELQGGGGVADMGAPSVSGVGWVRAGLLCSLRPVTGITGKSNILLL